MPALPLSVGSRSRDDRRRPADADDLHLLREVATVEDWNIARQAVALIEFRGFARERDLVDRLDTLIRSGAYE